MELDPLTGDGIKAEIDRKDKILAGADPTDLEDPDEIEVPNTILDELLDFYKCQHLHDFAERILWLRDVKEALGYIPKSFGLVYDEIVGLTILLQEQRLREACDAHKSRVESERMRSKASSSSASARHT